VIIPDKACVSRAADVVDAQKVMEEVTGL